MQPAALGLACKESMEIFSQNETLRLQRENKELRTRLARYEPNPRIFSTRKEYLEVESEAMEFLFHWIRNNTKANSSVGLDCYGLYYGNGYGDFLPQPQFMQTIEHAIHMITDNRDLSHNISGMCLDIVDAALQSAFIIDNFSLGDTGMWCRDQEAVADIVCRSLMPDKIPELIAHAVEYPEEEW